MHEFSQAGPNLIRSSSGRSIELLGRAGILYRFDGTAIEISSEMLHTPMSVGIYAKSIPTGLSLSAAEILEETIGALEFAGFTVAVVS